VDDRTYNALLGGLGGIGEREFAVLTHLEHGRLT
jgi:hypothetical protein